MHVFFFAFKRISFNIEIAAEVKCVISNKTHVFITFKYLNTFTI